MDEQLNEKKLFTRSLIFKRKDGSLFRTTFFAVFNIKDLVKRVFSFNYLDPRQEMNIHRINV